MQSALEIRDILNKTLTNFWGYKEYRDSQEEIILSVVHQKDTVALLPTGAGKSLCYQLPALVLEGTCIVVSPLLALMKEQVFQLKSVGIEAEYLSSELDEYESEEIYNRVTEGLTKILYVSPERLSNTLFIQKIAEVQVSFIAVDEAHCISEWGQDFRPSYRNIKNFRNQFINVPCIALTATATPKVIKDIKEKLDLHQPQLFQKSYKRDNIKIIHDEINDKYQRIFNYLNQQNSSGIIYARTRKECEDLTFFLKQKGISKVDFYHAGLSLKDKNAHQKKWIGSNNHVLVSTNAFGMGIDKDNVRFVMHLSPSASIENYYQEIGRAGRDGEESFAYLLWNEQELANIDNTLYNQIPNKTEFSKIISYLYSTFQIAENELPEKQFQLHIQKIQNFTKLSIAKIKNVLLFLHHQEVIYFNNHNSLSSLEIKIPLGDLEDLAKKDMYFIELLLRNLSGIASHKVLFSEQSLSDKIRVSTHDFKERIIELQKKGYLEYLDGNQASIKFLHPREDRAIQGKYWNLFEQIQRNKLQKWEEMKYFIRNKDFCKMKMILTYFGEKNAKNCGNCYVCTENHDQFTVKDLSEDLLQALREQPYTFDELQVKLYHYSKENIFEALISLLNLDKIKMLNYKTYMLNEA
ncbi:MAG: RecQ family ATP-dependent DNA helicase [Cloacibacterium sp.]|nr:RecQ family ATP-dependent DNA helicase [Cloacibacterium sp.]